MKKSRATKGSALLLAVIVVLLAAGVGGSFLIVNLTNARTQQTISDQDELMAMCDAGVERAKQALDIYRGYIPSPTYVAPAGAKTWTWDEILTYCDNNLAVKPANYWDPPDMHGIMEDALKSMDDPKSPFNSYAGKVSWDTSGTKWDGVNTKSAELTVPASPTKPSTADWTATGTFFGWNIPYHKGAIHVYVHNNGGKLVDGAGNTLKDPLTGKLFEDTQFEELDNTICVTVTATLSQPVSSMNNLGSGSLFTMVQRMAFVASNACTGLARASQKVSFVSRLLSPGTSTVTFATVLPGGKLTMPLVGRKSIPTCALPDMAAYSADTARPLGAESRSLNTTLAAPALPSGRVTSIALITGNGSSFTIVTVAESTPSTALTGACSRTKNASSASLRRSPTTLTSTPLLVSPGRNVRVVLSGTKSDPASAEFVTVRQLTFTVRELGFDSTTATVTLVRPACPSSVTASTTETIGSGNTSTTPLAALSIVEVSVTSLVAPARSDLVPATVLETVTLIVQVAPTARLAPLNVRRPPERLVVAGVEDTNTAPSGRGLVNVITPDRLNPILRTAIE
jgi:hypothetical protein